MQYHDILIRVWETRGRCRQASIKRGTPVHNIALPCQSPDWPKSPPVSTNNSRGVTTEHLGPPHILLGLNLPARSSPPLPRSSSPFLHAIVVNSSPAALPTRTAAWAPASLHLFFLDQHPPFTRSRHVSLDGIFLGRDSLVASSPTSPLPIRRSVAVAVAVASIPLLR